MRRAADSGATQRPIPAGARGDSAPYPRRRGVARDVADSGATQQPIPVAARGHSAPYPRRSGFARDPACGAQPTERRRRRRNGHDRRRSAVDDHHVQQAGRDPAAGDPASCTAADAAIQETGVVFCCRDDVGRADDDVTGGPETPSPLLSLSSLCQLHAHCQ